MSNADANTLIENRVNSGILGQWYPVSKSVEVTKDKPHGV